MTFTFHKGTHRAWPLYWLHWWLLLINPVTIGRRVTFSFSAKYNLHDDDQADHNKLFGISYSLSPHRNSARFGWRFDPGKSKFILSAYCYLNGERIMEDLCEVVAGRKYDCVLMITSSEYLFHVKQVDNGNVFARTAISKGHRKKNGYLLGPYFGGNRVAPNKMTIQMKRI
jgi:hypothetical protein